MRPLAPLHLPALLLLLALVLTGCGSGITAPSSPAPAVSPVALLTDPPLPTAVLDRPYTDILHAHNGVAPYTFALTSGTLPPGLSLAASGQLLGSPTAAGAYTFQVTVTDSNTPPGADTHTFSLLSAPPLQLNATPPAATLNSPYIATLVSGGIPPYTLSLPAGTLPTGLTLSPTGLLSGTPTTGGQSTLTLQVADTSGQTATTTLAVAVLTATVSIDPSKPLATLPATAFGIHTAIYDPSLADTAALPALLATAGIRLLRYPGGSYADRFHWAQNTLTPTFATPRPACHLVSLGYLAPNTDFGSFVRTLAATGTEAILTVNYGTGVADSHATRSPSNHSTNQCSEPNTAGQPEEAAAWVAYANGSPSDTHVLGIDEAGFDWKTTGFWAGLRAASPLATDDGYNFLRLGLPSPIHVRFWEIGNEIYYNGWNNNINTETDLHAPYIYPSGYGSAFTSRLGVPALAPAVYGGNAARYIAAMRAVDPSIQIGIVVGDAIDPISAAWTPAVLHAVCAATTFDFAILHYYPGTYNAVTAADLLSLPQTQLPKLVSGLHAAIAAACPANPANTPIFITETNPNGTLAPNTPPTVSGLFAAHVLLSALDLGIENVDWLELHGGAGTFLSSPAEAPGPAFFGIELAHLLAGPGDILLSTTSSSPTLVVHAAHHATGGNAVLLLNTDPTTPATVQLTLPASPTPNSTATEVTFGPDSTPTTSTLPSTRLTLSSPSLTLTIPPFTATELLLP